MTEAERKGWKPGQRSLFPDWHELDFSTSRLLRRRFGRNDKMNSYNKFNFFFYYPQLLS